MSDNKHNPVENSGEVTQLLQRWAGGDASALDSLWPMVYDDVRQLARRQLAAERSSHTLQGTALVNEAFIKLAGQHSTKWQNRDSTKHFSAHMTARFSFFS